MTSHCTEESLETNRIVSSEILRYVDVFSISHNYLCCQILKSSSQVLLMYDCGMFTGGSAVLLVPVVAFGDIICHCVGFYTAPESD